MTKQFIIGFDEEDLEHLRDFLDCEDDVEVLWNVTGGMATSITEID